jgi:hypothetical protein
MYVVLARIRKGRICLVIKDKKTICDPHEHIEQQKEW